MKISLPDQFFGRDFDEVKSELEKQIRDACGDGTLCVSVISQVDDDPSNDDNVNCNGLAEPKPSGEIPRGGTLVLLVNHRCDPPAPTSTT